MKKSAINAEPYECDICSFYATKLSDWSRHISTQKHKNSIIFNQKKGEEYVCTLCDALCSTKFDLKMHQMTAEHRKNVKIQSKNTPVAAKHKCSICEKEYKTSNSLWYHNKKCVPKIIEPLITNGATIVPQNCDLIAELLKQNNELQKQIIDLAKEPKIINNNNYNSNNQCTNNTTNNQFNLNMFLNETCKDALNIDDFMDSLQLTVNDLEETGRLGFVQGITRIFLQGLKDLDVTRRPFHCTDIKRETVYIKDQDRWEKETTEKKLMKQALNQVVRKNLKMIHVWREDHPDYLRSNTQDNDDYMKIYLSSLGSQYDDEQQRMDEKIIRNVLREIILDKKNELILP
jgi:hypothetical protein